MTMWGLSGAHKVSRIRSQVGTRKSYGTNRHTCPCHVRSAAGFDSSCHTALITMAIMIKRASCCSGDFGFRPLERPLDRLIMRQVSTQAMPLARRLRESHSPVRARTERPLILRGLISMNRFRTPVSHAEASK
jgi:hypothetical protein